MSHATDRCGGYCERGEHVRVVFLWQHDDAGGSARWRSDYFRRICCASDLLSFLCSNLTVFVSSIFLVCCRY
jgi:hypothetical protein